MVMAYEEPDPPSLCLTDRQKEILLLYAQGKGYKEISAILHLQYRTVRNHLDHARKQLGAITTIHAIYIAMQLGLIQ